jgi:hypothetical protein
MWPTHTQDNSIGLAERAFVAGALLEKCAGSSRSKIETLLCELRPTERLLSRFRFPRVSSQMSNPDRRRAQRIPLQQAVSVVIGNDGHEAPAITDNFSSAGVLLYADQLIPEGSEIGLILVVPPAEAEAEGKRMWCFGKVLRVEKELKEGRFGIAIGFQRWEVLSQA